MKPILAFTLGDPGGIGPEILVDCLKNPKVRKSCFPLAIGSREVLQRSGWREGCCPVLDPGFPAGRIRRCPNAEAGRSSFEAVRLAASLARRGLIHGLVTAPVSKEAWAEAGVPYTDHTSFLEDFFGGSRAGMMLEAGGLKAILATRHMALREVPRRLTSASVLRAARLADSALRGLGIPSPRLGLCALNPHAGESGLLGDEEERVLEPTLRRLQREGVRVQGPIAADAAWAAHAQGRVDALVCLYHDQAMIPLKARAPYGVVNWTVGLPLPRTAPGHGTAFDIAGRGKASPLAMEAAALLAASLARRILSARK